MISNLLRPVCLLGLPEISRVIVTVAVITGSAPVISPHNFFPGRRLWGLLPDLWDFLFAWGVTPIIKKKTICFYVKQHCHEASKTYWMCRKEKEQWYKHIILKPWFLIISKGPIFYAHYNMNLEHLSFFLLEQLCRYTTHVYTSFSNPLLSSFSTCATHRSTYLWAQDKGFLRSLL